MPLSPDSFMVVQTNEVYITSLKGLGRGDKIDALDVWQDIAMVSPLNSSYRFLFRAIAVILLAAGGGAISTPVRAATVNWALKFFDSGSGSQIGSGSFAYDDSQPLDVTVNLFDEDPIRGSVTVEPSEQWFELTSFSAKIADSVWNLSDSPNPILAWQPTGTATPSSRGGAKSVVIAGREPIIYKSDSWFFGEPYFGIPALDIDNGSFVLTYQGAEEVENYGGSWIATQVPEPVSILGTATLGLGILAQRRRGKKRLPYGR